MIAAAVVSGYAIPLGALILSAGALLYSVVTMKQRTESELISQLYVRIEDLEGQVSATEVKCAAMEKKLVDVQDENFRLMRRLLAVEREP